MAVAAVPSMYSLVWGLAHKTQHQEAAYANGMARYGRNIIIYNYLIVELNETMKR